MKLNILLLILFTTLSCALYGQDSLSQQQVQLIDGSVFKAQILEQGDDFTRVKIVTGDVLLLNNELIRSIGELNLVTVENLSPSRRSALQHKGIYNIFSQSLLIGRDAKLFESDLTIGSSMLSFVRGYQINQYIGFGAGLGLDIYDHKFVPFHLDFRGNFNLWKVTMYYAFQGGYSLSSSELGSGGDSEIKGGLLLHPSVGVKIPTRTKLDVLIGIGYRRQRAIREDIWSDNDYEITYRRYAIRVGLAF